MYNVPFLNDLATLAVGINTNILAAAIEMYIVIIDKANPAKKHLNKTSMYTYIYIRI